MGEAGQIRGAGASADQEMPPFPPAEDLHGQALRPTGVVRQNSKDALRARANGLRMQAGMLDALCDALPEVLPADAEAALWNLVLRSG